MYTHPTVLSACADQTMSSWYCSTILYTELCSTVLQYRTAELECSVGTVHTSRKHVGSVQVRISGLQDDFTQRQNDEVNSNMGKKQPHKHRTHKNNTNEMVVIKRRCSEEKRWQWEGVKRE
jgi:hypothetical protein